MCTQRIKGKASPIATDVNENIESLYCHAVNVCAYQTRTVFDMRNYSLLFYFICMHRDKFSICIHIKCSTTFACDNMCYSCMANFILLLDKTRNANKIYYSCKSITPFTHSQLARTTLNFHER